MPIKFNPLVHSGFDFTGAASGGGTVTSVALADSTGLFNITGSPITTSGTLTLASFASQLANKVFAAPNGSNGAPTFRSLVAADLPSSIVSSIGPFGSTPNSAGGVISAQVLTLEPADATNPGGVSITTQTFAGDKTFSDSVSISTLVPGQVVFPGAAGLLTGSATLTWDESTQQFMAQSAHTMGGLRSTAFGDSNTATGNDSFASGSGTTASGANSHSEGISTQATASSAHAEGNSTIASGQRSHAEGQSTTATASNAHSEGRSTNATGLQSHAEGRGSLAAGINSHAEGFNTQANGDQSHAEGTTSIATGVNSHAEGNNTQSLGDYSHSEGSNTQAGGINSHAEGDSNSASGISSHAEGGTDINDATPAPNSAGATSSHAEGANNSINGAAFASHAEGYTNIIGSNGQYSHVEGSNNTTDAQNAHAEGNLTEALGNSSHSEGFQTRAIGDYSHAEGSSSDPGNNGISSGLASHSEGADTIASGNSSHAEGESTLASGSNSHAEGISTQATADSSHAEGNGSVASAARSHAEGQTTTASAVNAHAEGRSTNATGAQAHAEGRQTLASGINSHAEGFVTIASGQASHSGGHSSTSEGDFSLAHGEGAYSQGHSQVAIGQFNTKQGTPGSYVTGDDAFIIGNGVDDSTRSNAFSVGNDGLITMDQGGQRVKIRSDSSTSITVDPRTDFAIGITSTSAVTIQLPPGVDGMKYIFKIQISNPDPSTQILPDGSDTIEGNPSLSINTSYQAITLVFEGGVWYVIARPPPIVAANRALQSDAFGVISASSVTSTELGYVSGVTSSIQTQINSTLRNVEQFTLSGAQITAKSVTLASAPGTPAKTLLLVAGAPNQDYSTDYTVSGSSLSWSALGLDGILAAGDKITVVYN